RAARPARAAPRPGEERTEPSSTAVSRGSCRRAWSSGRARSAVRGCVVVRGRSHPGRGATALLDVPDHASRPSPVRRRRPTIGAMDVRTPFRRLPAAVQDALIAVLVAVKQVVATAYLEATEPGAVIRPLSDLGNLGYVILAVTGLALVARRRFPAAVFVLTALASLLYYALD